MNPIFMNSSFSFTFEAKVDIQDYVKVMESYLSEEYQAAQLNTVASDADPTIPRIGFIAKNGTSQILFSQVNAVLNIGFTPDMFQNSEAVVQQFIDHVDYLKDLIEELHLSLHYCGVMCMGKIDYTTLKTPQEVVGILQELFFKSPTQNSVLDIEFKTAQVIQERYYANVLIKNSKSFSRETFEKFKGRVPLSQIHEHGVEVLVDFNDRYIYNENSDYQLSVEAFDTMIKESYELLSNNLQQFK